MLNHSGHMSMYRNIANDEFKQDNHELEKISVHNEHTNIHNNDPISLYACRAMPRTHSGCRPIYGLDLLRRGGAVARPLFSVGGAVTAQQGEHEFHNVGEEVLCDEQDLGQADGVADP